MKLGMQVALFNVLLAFAATPAMPAMDPASGTASKGATQDRQENPGQEDAQADKPPDDPGKDAPVVDKAAELAKSQTNKEFLGIKFGLGLGFSYITGEVIDEAEVVDGIVRIKKSTNARPRIVLESHYFFQLDTSERVVPVGEGTLKINAATIGIGPFVAIQSSTDKVLDSIGLGGMVGFRRQDNSLNIGVGLIVDPSVKRLGDGIVENEPLPGGETEVRLAETSRWGVLVLTSFTF